MSLRKKFISHLDDLRAYEGWRAYEAMSVFLTCAYTAIRKTTEFGETADSLEAEYMQVVGRCQKPQKTMAILPKMLRIVTEALEHELRDFIGPVFMETSASERMGQFFTPDDVCFMMAMTQLHDAHALLETQSHIKIDEPACGAGAMILAACRYLKSIDVNFQTSCYFRLTDLDHDAFMAAYIQCSLAGIPAHVVHGNTLTLEIRTVAQTPMLMINPWLAREPKEKQAQVLAKAPVKTSKPVQLRLDLGV